VKRQHARLMAELQIARELVGCLPQYRTSAALNKLAGARARIVDAMDLLRIQFAELEKGPSLFQQLEEPES